MSEFYFSIVPKKPPQVKNKIYFNFVDFLLAFLLKIAYNLNMVVGQTAINYLRGHKMGNSILLALALYGAYKLFPIILDWILDNT